MNKFTELLQKEYELLKQMLTLAEEQQTALIRYDIGAIERTTLKLNEVTREMKQCEDERINFLIKELKLNRREALTAKLTDISKKIDIPAILLEKREEIANAIERLANVSSLNRLLINRALISINEILSTLSNPQNSVCNVRI
jgi:hypothetical protein